MSLSKHKLQEIGKKLRQTRIENKVSLEKIAADTLISKRVLIAIEEGNWQQLPEPFYVKALIAKYAKAIGVKENLDVDFTDNSLALVHKPIQTSVIVETKSKPTQNKGAFAFQLKSSHLYLIYVALIIIVVKAIATFVEKPVIVNNQTIKEEAPVETVVPIDESTPTTISSASPSQFISQSNSNNSDVVVVDISLKERCWLKVMVDGKVEFEGTLPKGTQRNWTGKKQINIIAGNAGGVVITYNHGQEKLLGKPGQVEEVTYTVN